MPKVRLLPDHVINQIAAGEVIERPVAIVKELVENSLDAGATKINIEFRKGGKSYIRIEDNGHGMDEENANLALTRHATSKISNVDDLEKIHSFGFRGEALPSIASVSKFTLKTRTASSDSGTEILINGGKPVYQKECGMPVGTCITVEHLFNTVPARRKFLKTDNTEAAHIVHLSRLLAIAHSETSFSLIENGRNVFQSPVCPSLPDRVREIFGKQMAEKLIPVEAESNDLRLFGLIGKPGVGRSTRQEMVTYVNGRPVDNRTLNYAIIESYHTYISKGRYPLAFLFLELDPVAVDVNVHPAKREVRFRNEGQIRNFAIQTIIDRLREESAKKSALSNATFVPSISTPSLPPQPPVTNTVTANPVDVSGVSNDAESTVTPMPLGKNIKDKLVPAPESAMEPDKPKASKAFDKPVSETVTARTDVPIPQTPSPAVKARAKWRFLGTTQNACLLFETESAVVVLNQRNAYERIYFESISKQMGSKQVASQKLLIPIPIELDPLTSNTLSENISFFNNNGFLIEPFGRHFFRVEEVPDWLDPGEGESFIRDLLGRIRERGINPNKVDLAQSEMARIAANYSVRAEKKIDPQSVHRLVDQLLACENPLTDPQGRSTFFEITHSELDKKFSG